MITKLMSYEAGEAHALNKAQTIAIQVNWQTTLTVFISRYHSRFTHTYDQNSPYDEKNNFRTTNFARVWTD
ncbi:MAG TPA: hypothetical protein EYQ00_02765 [Dehalococcoidia bacterium]|nr:hypothetical protein [Dehalococcoidia bacterium]